MLGGNLVLLLSRQIGDIITMMTARSHAMSEVLLLLERQRKLSHQITLKLLQIINLFLVLEDSIWWPKQIPSIFFCGQLNDEDSHEVNEWEIHCKSNVVKHPSNSCIEAVYLLGEFLS